MAWIDVLNSIGQNAGMNNSELGIADTLFRGGNYDRLVQKYLKDSGAYQSMSPYYYQALVKNAKRLALQSILEDVAGGASAEESVSSENFGRHLQDLMSTPGGLGWKRPSETRPMFAQALANIASWGAQPEGTQARAIYDYIMTDPDMLKALGLVAMGPGYGGAFNQAYTDAYSNWLDNQSIWAGTDNPNAQTNFWNTMLGIYGGIANTGTPSPLSNTPNMRMGATGSIFGGTPKVGAPAVGGGAGAPAGGGAAAAATPGGTPAGSPQSPAYQSTGQGTIVNTPAEAAALANGSGAGPNYEGIEIEIPAGSGNKYRYTKDTDGKWKVVPSSQYGTPGGGAAAAAAVTPDAGAGGAAAQAVNPYFDNGMQSPQGAGPAVTTPIGGAPSGGGSLAAVRAQGEPPYTPKVGAAAIGQPTYVGGGDEGTQAAIGPKYPPAFVNAALQKYQSMLGPDGPISMPLLISSIRGLTAQEQAAIVGQRFIRAGVQYEIVRTPLGIYPQRVG